MSIQFSIIEKKYILLNQDKPLLALSRKTLSTLAQILVLFKKSQDNLPDNCFDSIYKGLYLYISRSIENIANCRFVDTIIYSMSLFKYGSNRLSLSVKKHI